MFIYWFDTYCWKTADDYLSGNVKDKIRQAVASGSEFRRNVAALEKVQPEDLPPAAIEPRLGAVWIPPATWKDLSTKCWNCRTAK